MKKIIALVMCMALAVSAVTAEKSSVIGVKGILCFSAGSEVSDDSEDLMKSTGNFDYTMQTTGGLALFIKNTFSNSLVLQTEFGYTENAIGYDYSAGGLTPAKQEVTMSCNTFNIGVLLGYDFNLAQNTVAFTPFIGLQTGVIVGDCESEVNGVKSSGSVDTFSILSFLMGAEALVSVGPGFIVIDGRYNLGLLPLMNDGNEIATFSALQLSAGYSFKL